MQTMRTDYDYGCTSTDLTICDDYDTSSKIEIRGCYKRDIEIVDNEEIEWIRSGWNNPRKINLPKFNLNKVRNLNIRNNLPRKFKLETRN